MLSAFGKGSPFAKNAKDGHPGLCWRQKVRQPAQRAGRRDVSSFCGVNYFLCQGKAWGAGITCVRYRTDSFVSTFILVESISSSDPSRRGKLRGGGACMAHPVQLQLNCSICDKPVDLKTTKTNEAGK